MAAVVFQIAVVAVFLVAVAAVVKWFAARNGMTVPEPVVIVFWAAVALFCLWVLAVLAGVVPRPAAFW